MTTVTGASVSPVAVDSQSFLLKRVQATHHPLTAFFTGAATAPGAGVRTAFSEGLSDTGDLTGRGSPMLRGAITGGGTFVGGIVGGAVIASLSAGLRVLAAG